MQRYDVVINGMATTLLLSDDEAHRRGLTKTKKPANKSRKPANKANG